MIEYTYTCRGCHFSFTEKLPVNDRYLPTTLPCPQCGEMEVLKDIGSALFQLKGYCWSKDNYTRTVGDDPNYKVGKYTKENEG